MPPPPVPPGTTGIDNDGSQNKMAFNLNAPVFQPINF